jgi:hypothetical protein
MRSITLLSTVVLTLVSCARMPESEPSFTPSASAYSASFSEGSQSFAIPEHQPIVADVVVRPDFLALNFAVRSTGKNADEALAKAKEEVASIAEKMKELAGAGTGVRPCGFRSERISEESAKAIVDGVVEIPLDSTTDYWSRAALMSKINALTTPPVAPPKKEAEEETAKAIIGFSAPRFLVRDPEKHRAELMKKWVERAKAFSEATGGGLRFKNCEPPAAIAQSPISFEEIALSLRMACQLDAPG